MIEKETGKFRIQINYGCHNVYRSCYLKPMFSWHNKWLLKNPFHPFWNRWTVKASSVLYGSYWKNSTFKTTTCRASFYYSTSKYFMLAFDLIADYADNTECGSVFNQGLIGIKSRFAILSIVYTKYQLILRINKIE